MSNDSDNFRNKTGNYKIINNLKDLFFEIILEKISTSHKLNKINNK